MTSLVARQHMTWDCLCLGCSLRNLQNNEKETKCMDYHHRGSFIQFPGEIWHLCNRLDNYLQLVL